MSSVGYGPLVRIDGPPPSRPRQSLITAAEAATDGVRIVSEPDNRWENGAQVYPFPKSRGHLHDTCAVGSDPHDKDYGEQVNLPMYGAFTGYVAITCTVYKVWDQDEFMSRATLTLDAVESSLIARQLMYGEGILANPHLADGNGTFPNGDAATSSENGLQLLEAAIAASGRQGVIHCSPMMATNLLGNGFALSDKTGVIRTINGIVVVPDFGYATPSTPAQTPSNGPHPAPSGAQEWAYATGPVDIRRSEIFVMPETVQQATDRGTGGATKGKPNSITYRAERNYLVDWDTEVQAAVLVDRCKTTCT